MAATEHQNNQLFDITSVLCVLHLRFLFATAVVQSTNDPKIQGSNRGTVGTRGQFVEQKLKLRLYQIHNC